MMQPHAMLREALANPEVDPSLRETLAAALDRYEAAIATSDYVAIAQLGLDLDRAAEAIFGAAYAPERTELVRAIESSLAVLHAGFREALMPADGGADETEIDAVVTALTGRS